MNMWLCGMCDQDIPIFYMLGAYSLMASFQPFTCYRSLHKRKYISLNLPHVFKQQFTEQCHDNRSIITLNTFLLRSWLALLIGESINLLDYLRLGMLSPLSGFLIMFTTFLIFIKQILGILQRIVQALRSRPLSLLLQDELQFSGVNKLVKGLQTFPNQP